MFVGCEKSSTPIPTSTPISGGNHRAAPLSIYYLVPPYPSNDWGDLPTMPGRQQKLDIWGSMLRPYGGMC